MAAFGVVLSQRSYRDASRDEPFSKNAPRVRPEAAEYASHGKHGTVGQLIAEGFSFGAPSSARRQPKQSKNHIEENVKRMRRIQREYKAAQQSVATENRPCSATATGPMKALWRSEKYASVPSKVAAELQKPELAPEKTYSSMTMHHDKEAADTRRPRSASSTYLRAHSRTGIPLADTADEPDTRNGVEKLNLSRASSCDNLSRLRENADFVKINGIAASQVALRRSPRATALEEQQREKAASYEHWKKSTLGTVPAYLQKRREQWEHEREERVRNTPDPDMPPGHRPMPTEERQQTLDMLHKTHRELQARLTALPICSDTLRLQKAKEELETKLTEVEEAIKVFSRPKVFIKID